MCANMVTRSRIYPWSSYCINAEGMKSDLIVPNKQFLRLGEAGECRRKAYRKIFKSHLEPDLLTDIRSSTNGNYVLGNERFKDEISNMLLWRVVPAKQGRPVKLK